MIKIILFISSLLFAQTIITKAQFTEHMKTALPNVFCAENQYFRKCFKVSEDECIKEAVRATKVCIASMESDMPAKLQQPKDGESWGTKLGTCAGSNYEVSLNKKKIDSKDCNDPEKWK
jgi:hypothetical protein